MIKSMFMLYVSLALGYGLCVVANKQSGILKTLGYTIGVATLVFSLLSGIIVSGDGCPMMNKMSGMMSKSGHCPMMK